MALPGTEYTSKYTYTKQGGTTKKEEEMEKKKKINKMDKDTSYYYHHYNPHQQHHDHQQQQHQRNELYEKYDSPALSVGLEGDALSSGSVSGTALQDPPTPHAEHTWQQMFNAGLYGTTVQHKTPPGGGGGGLAGRPRVSVCVCVFQ